ncbi:MAG: glutathione S-transferase family protein [Rubrivivax sp.]|jgi:glutathione S-transferase|nr:glutathione S-transferase family protein [Rubrivivax sp.]
MLLHDLTPGMHPRRVRIFLAEKGLSIPRKEVDAAGLANETPEFLKLNPLGKLPVLELDDGTTLSESLAICRHLDELHPNPPLLGSTSVERARIDMWTLRMEFELSRPIAQVFLHTGEFYRGRMEQVPEVARHARSHALATMQWLNSELNARQHMAGDGYSMADIVAQCAFVLGKAAGLRIPPEMAHLSRWFAAVSARPTARA